jgi:hypothetical protein
MNRQLHTQLDKILAMADSGHDGEAVVAVRKARQVLSNNGLSFSDLARAAQRPRPINLPFFAASPTVELEIQNNELRQRLAEANNDVVHQSAEAELWRRRAAELEQKLAASQLESKRWRLLARDTVEKLWDLGQSVREDEFTADEPVDAKIA